MFVVVLADHNLGAVKPPLALEVGIAVLKGSWSSTGVAAKPKVDGLEPAEKHGTAAATTRAVF
jgi:hypothetical protein